MIVTGSPDISILQVLTTWDISGTLPVIRFSNLSEGPNLANISYWFQALSPTGTFIHEGVESSPDITGIWTDYTINDAWPRPFNQIEYSGAPYLVNVYAKDSEGNIFTVPYSASICRPQGNTPLSKNFYGRANIDVQVMCDQARIWFEDKTDHSYKGIDGTRVSSVLTIVYPIDETGNIPDKFVLNDFSTALVPISYSSDNYQFMTNIIYDYDLGGYSHVKIRYQSINPKNGSFAITFPVLCNIDLSPLVCEYLKLIDNVEKGNCSDVTEANRKLSIINSKMALVYMGKTQPLTGIDVPKLIREIEEIGGFACNCCEVATGIIPQTSSVVDGYNFSVVSLGGDISGEFLTTGFNIQLKLSDKSYIFKICDTAPTEAFTVTPTISGDGYTKTYCLNVSLQTLFTDGANAILADADLLNLWQSICNNTNNGNFNLIVDGSCIFQSTAACDYSFTLSNIPLNTTYAIITSIKVGSVVHSLNFQFNLTNLPALQTYLNALNIGTFVITNPSGQTVLISSTANNNSLLDLVYKIAGTVYIGDLSKICTGYIPLSANEVVQNIIDYICTLNDADVTTSQDYSICYVDPTTKQKVTVTVNEGTTLASLLQQRMTADCNTVDYVTGLGAVTCASIQAIFPQSVSLMQATDYFLGTKGGLCARIFPVEGGTRILQLGAYNQDFLDAFCALVTQCGSGLSCAPYTLFQVSVTSFNNTCAAISDFNYSFSGSNLNIDKVIFGNTPSTTQTITVEYKLTSGSTYTVFSTSASIGTNGIPALAISIPLTVGQSYDIRLSNNCSSPIDYFIKSLTVPGTSDIIGIYTANITTNNIIINGVIINGISQEPLLYSGAFPINPTESASSHPSETGVFTVEVDITSSAGDINSINLQDSNGNIQCINVFSEIATVFFYGVAVNNSNPLTITTSNGECS